MMRVYIPPPRRRFDAAHIWRGIIAAAAMVAVMVGFWVITPV